MDNLKEMGLAEMLGLELKQTNGGETCDKGHEGCNPGAAEDLGEDVRNVLLLGLAIFAAGFFN